MGRMSVVFFVIIKSVENCRGGVVYKNTTRLLRKIPELLKKPHEVTSAGGTESH